MKPKYKSVAGMKGIEEKSLPGRDPAGHGEVLCSGVGWTAGTQAAAAVGLLGHRKLGHRRRWLVLVDEI
jgi:hypothetical protein